MPPERIFLNEDSVALVPKMHRCEPLTKVVPTMVLISNAGKVRFVEKVAVLVEPDRVNASCLPKSEELMRICKSDFSQWHFQLSRKFGRGGHLRLGSQPSQREGGMPTARRLRLAKILGKFRNSLEECSYHP